MQSSYNHQSNGQADACIKFVKQNMKKCFDSNNMYGFIADQTKSDQLQVMQPGYAHI